MKKIGIYGGAFNPVHYGHLRTAEDVYEALSLDRILFIPSGRTPFDKPDLAKASHRLEMIRKAIRGNRHFAVSDLEIKSRSKSYTVDTVKRLKKQYQRSELFFILGIDAFLDLPYWKQPDRLMELVSFIVISRPGCTFTALYSSPYLRGMSKKVLKELDHGRRRTQHGDSAGNRKIVLCNVTALNISASDIRNIINTGKSINYLLPDSVKSYIISNNVYKKNKLYKLVT
jgi:nicotinate-nucleotide adenylyltransferase